MWVVIGLALKRKGRADRVLVAATVSTGLVTATVGATV